MASGWSKDGNEQLEIQAALDAAISVARSQISTKASLEYCLDCSEPIPVDRQNAISGVKYCLSCQEEHDIIFKRPERNCWHRSMR